MANNYILTFYFDEKGIDTLKRAGEQVAIVRMVEPSRAGELAWLTFFPRTVSTVTWDEEDYCLFVCQLQGDPQPGMVFQMNSVSEPVVPGGFYSLNDTGLFVRVPEKSSADGVVTVSNDGPMGYRDNMYFGLAQSGTVFSDDNTTAVRPLNAQFVPYNQQATFTMTTRVRLFTSDIAQSSIVGNNVSSKILDLNFYGPELEVTYDSSTNAFFQGRWAE